MERVTIAQSMAAAAQERAIRAADVRFYEARVAGDPRGSTDRAHLAALLLQRARETNDERDLTQAEGLARASITLRPNGEASAVLASALLAQHRFVEAREAARALVADEPGIDAYRATLGETCLELGDYAGAAAAFDGIRPEGRRSLAVAPRLARWAEMRGDTAARAADPARRRARRAARHGARSGMSREQAAWFQLRIADFDARYGRPERAERALHAGLVLNPGDHRLLTALARLAAARHDWARTIALGDSANAMVLDPATLGLVSDAYAATGDTAQAAEYAAVMQIAVGQQIGTYHRAWSLFLLDHGRRVPEVLAAARAELVDRRDVQGHDLLAWALYRSGRAREARVAMAAALAPGMQDAMLLYHAGMIARADGDPVAARDYLRRALAIAPAFDHAAPTIARAVLDSLDAERPATR